MERNKDWGIINLAKCAGELAIWAIQDALTSVDDALDVDFGDEID